jgi:hypothetical protein
MVELVPKRPPRPHSLNWGPVIDEYRQSRRGRTSLSNHWSSTWCRKMTPPHALALPAVRPLPLFEGGRGSHASEKRLAETD